MIKIQARMNYLFMILALFISVGGVSSLASESYIPLKNAIGDEIYNDAIGSGNYRYVGNSKCRLCHRKFFIGRKSDLHDHAMDSLVANAEDKNPECLACHTTGYGIPTGFVSMETTPRLSHVQCEGCHGPGNVHIQLAKDKVKKPKGFLAGPDNPDRLKKMCVNCHTQKWNKSYKDLDEAYNRYRKAAPTSKSKSVGNK